MKFFKSQILIFEIYMKLRAQFSNLYNKVVVHRSLEINLGV